VTATIVTIVVVDAVVTVSSVVAFVGRVTHAGGGGRCRVHFSVNFRHYI